MLMKLKEEILVCKFKNVSLRENVALTFDNRHQTIT